MKKLLALALLAVVASGADAKTEKDSVNKNKPVFHCSQRTPHHKHKGSEQVGHLLGLFHLELL